MLYRNRVLLFTAFIISLSGCNIPEDAIDVQSMIDRERFLFSQLDSLVYTGETDHVAFLDSLINSQDDHRVDDLYYKYIGHYHFYNHRDPLKALSYTDSTLLFLEDKKKIPGYDRIYIRVTRLKGNVLMDMNLYNQAFQVYQQAWDVIRLTDDPCIEADFMKTLGEMSYKQEDYLLARNYIRQAFQVRSNCSETELHPGFSQYSYYHYMDSIYDKLAMPDSSLHYATAALNFTRQQNTFPEGSIDNRYYLSAEAIALANMARAYLKLGDSTNVEQHLISSISLNQLADYDQPFTQLTRLRLADFYLDINLVNEAGEQLQHVQNFLDTNNHEVVGLRWNKINIKWLHKSGQTDQVYEAHERYLEKETAAHSQIKELAQQDLERQITFYEHQNEIIRLQAEAELRNYYLVSIMIITLMAIIILFLTWKNWKQSQKELVQSINLNKVISNKNAELEDKSKTISRITNMVAHDLRSPLSGVIGLSSLLIEDEQLNEEQKEMIGMMLQSSNQCVSLVNEIVNIDFTNENSIELAPEPVDIQEFLKECIGLLQFQADKKNQTIELDIADNKTVAIDRGQMLRVINNLIYNAIKFSPENSTITVRSKQVNHSLQIAVQDNGIGIPEHLKKSVFDFYTSARRPGTQNENSHGLGLAISKRIIHAHNGNIWFESENEKGATFYIELPLS